MDMRHIFGGMLGGVALLAAYIVGWGIMQRCNGMEISRPAGDGANTVTLEVDERGDVVGERCTTVYVAPRYEPLSGDRVLIGDFEYIIIGAADWARMTNAVARLEAVAERRWTKEHQTADGRRAWHGAETNRVISADGRSVTWLYGDGYTHTEKAEPRRRAYPAAKKIERAEKERQPSEKVPLLLRAKREAMAARPKTREVNATFGPGGKVLKMEDAR